jgi:hypothetical protein
MIAQKTNPTLVLVLASIGIWLPSVRADDSVKPKDPFTKEQRAYWSFAPLKRPVPPTIPGDARVQNPIDAFIEATLEAKAITLSPEADKITLIRRASLDLTGLPPTSEEVQAFANDTSADAFENVVDRLLASPQYGERWARHWLDLARYAESEGFKADETRPNAWRYRDYVIRSFNQDKPYDRFIKEQIAGDELWPDEPEALIATAFNRHYPDESNARNLMQRRQEILNDITDTAGAVFTGMTFACARCHDHKFDPILQVDYYRLQAFFANTAAADNIALASPEVLRDYQQKLKTWEAKTKKIRDAMTSLEAPKREEIIRDYVEKYPEEIQTALAKSESERTPFECQMAAKAKLYLDSSSHQYIASASAVAAQLKGEAKKLWEELRSELEQFADLAPRELPIGTGITDISSTAPETFVLQRGIYDAQQEKVEPGFLSIIDPAPAKIVPCLGIKSSGRRTALANILTDPQNPLTARVLVNRIWHYHFGRGIVATPSDFGVKGERPTHPELLDWLAAEVMESGWSIKKMHRLIMTSSTYRQSSDYRAGAAKIDPENKLFWRFPRQRLEGEVIRDSALAVSGLLNLQMEGPSVFPELPPGMESRGGWKLDNEPAERNRRSIYVFVRRNTRYPMFESFDMPDTHESCPRRNITTSPIQALTMMNSKLSLEWAQSLAARVMEMAGSDFDREIDTAYHLALARGPDSAEKSIVKSFFDRQRTLISERLLAGEGLALPPLREATVDPVKSAVLVDFCHMLLNSNEFVYRN